MSRAGRSLHRAVVRGATSLLLGASRLVSQQTVEQVTAELAGLYEAGAVELHGQQYGYRLLRPLPQFADRERPLVVFLHGAGERGDDNCRQLYWLPRELATPAARQARPCFVLAVQCPVQQRWVEVPWGEREPSPFAAQPGAAMQAVQLALQRVLDEPGVDRHRVYLTGLSMGGYGTWDLLARQPDTFAASLAVCGGGDPAVVERFVAVPIEVWHGAADQVVPVQRSRLMVRALGELGVAVRYHELDGVGHDVWKQAYGAGGGLDWLFAQDQRQQLRGDRAEPAIVPRPELVTRSPGRFALLLGARCVIDEPLRTVATAVLDRLGLPAVQRPGVVADIEPSDGDLVLMLEPALGDGYELRIGERIELRAGDLAAAWRGGAALLQALSTWPAANAPHCLVRQRRALARGRLCLGAAPGGRSRAEVAALLDACWLAGVVELSVADEAQLRQIVELAAGLSPAPEDLGLACCGTHGLGAAAIVVDPQSGADQLLLAPVPAAVPDAAVAFELHVAPGPSAMQLEQLRRQLPALVERVARAHGPVHVGGFLVRASAWRRLTLPH